MAAKKYLLIALLITILAACNDNNADEGKYQPPVAPQITDTATTTTTSTATQQNITKQEGTNQKSVQLPKADAQKNAAVNPAHGQPGHRCDIPVGTPLNSKPTAVSPNQNPVVTVNPANGAQQQTNKEKTTSSVALNPAHGQPGHRCDIAVGAPLNQVKSPTKN